MKQLIGNIELFNRETKEFEPASVYQELDTKNHEDFERLWKPMLTRHSAGDVSPTISVNAKAPDSHWLWVDKSQVAANSLQYETFAVECGGITQGLMLVDVTKFARLDAHRGREMVYVELLASAPWNRNGFMPNPVYKGVGQVLVATAISLSTDLGFNGRIGLHALTSSESWYRDAIGFTDCGYDENKKMSYFEMSEMQAASFLAV